MIRGFFAGSELAQVTKPMSMVPKCGACQLYKKCETPKMKTYGKGGQEILIVTPFPTREEDSQGKRLVGSLGKQLRQVVAKNGLSFKSDCYLDHALICAPPDDEEIKDDHLDYCRPNIIKTIERLKPKVIIPVGIEPTRSIIGWLWKENPGSLDRWVGWEIPSQKLNAWICPTYHPDFVKREERRNNPIPGLMFDRHIARALQLSDTRPWEEVPDWTKEVEIVLEPERAARYIRKMIAKGGPVAFDYECNMLKPEGDKARILSAAVCWRGRKTIAYPWHGEAITATRELLRSPLPKIAANLKFEDRWTRKLVGTEIRNWLFDTMIGAHVLDSREGITSLKFQAFVRLGMSSYNNHIERFFDSADSMSPNSIIEQISLNDLLLYNGLDALLEYKLAVIQMADLGIDQIKGL